MDQFMQQATKFQDNAGPKQNGSSIWKGSQILHDSRSGSSIKIRQNSYFQLGTLEKMDNLLEMTTFNLNCSKISQPNVLETRTKLPSLSEHIKRTTMMQQLDCYDQGAACIIKDEALTIDAANDKIDSSDLPAVRLRKINQRFQKHLRLKYHQIVQLIEDFV